MRIESISRLAIMAIGLAVVQICFAHDDGYSFPHESISSPSNDSTRNVLQKIDPTFILTELTLHPLDPLTADEISLSVSIIRLARPNTWVFRSVSLQEPPKSILYPLLEIERKGKPILPKLPRKSFSVLDDLSVGEVYEVIINLKTKQIESFAKTAQKSIYGRLEWEYVIGNDTRVQKRVQDLGFTMNQIVLEPWPAYYGDGFPRFRGKHMFVEYLYAQLFQNDNFYAHPLDFVVVYDINQFGTIWLEDNPVHDLFTVRDNNRGVTVPRRPDNFIPDLPGFEPGRLRDDQKPLNVNFPQGPSYTVDGNAVSWQKFKFRIGFNSREGATLHNVAYEDKDKMRSLFYRLSVSELAVAYGDPRSPYHNKQSFDEGFFGAGNPLSSLVLGEDCIGAPTFLSTTIVGDNGEPEVIPNSICITEEDDGILWKHTSAVTQKSEIARSRRLSITATRQIGNYQYLFSWHFYQDATISFEIRATGQVSINLLARGSPAFPAGTIVFPQIYAPYHEHLATIRIDPMIDGQKNTVTTMDVVTAKGDTGSPTNPYGNAFTLKETVLKTPGQARTNLAFEKARTWKISNDKHIHPFTEEPVGWKLIPMNGPSLMLKQSSPFWKREAFAQYAIWVTQYKDDQYFAAGKYVEGYGLPEWVEESEDVNVENEDIVVWHTLTFAHIPRVEDFPVMPEDHFGFTLKPYNFFLGSPAMDVP